MPKRAPAPNPLSGLLEVLSVQEIAARLDVSTKTVQRWATHGTPKGQRKALASIVITDQERLDAKVKEIARDARRARQMQRPGDAPRFNTTTRQETRRYQGTVTNVRMPRKEALLSDQNTEEIVHKIMTQAKKLGRRQRAGQFFVTLGLVELGVTIGSGGKKLASVTRGPLGGFAAYQTFASTSPDYGQGSPRGAGGLAALEIQVRDVVERLAHTPRHAAVLDHFTVKRYTRKE